MAIVKASTLISAAPSKVRSIFLDFPNISNWEKTFVKSMTPLGPDGKSNGVLTGYTLKPNDKLHCVFWGGETDMTILENSERCFKWQGIWLGFTAERSFIWEEVEGGKCNLVQTEEAKGVMGGILKMDMWLGGNLEKKFLAFNEGLKKEAEKA